MIMIVMVFDQLDPRQQLEYNDDYGDHHDGYEGNDDDVDGDDHHDGGDDYNDIQLTSSPATWGFP